MTLPILLLLTTTVFITDASAENQAGAGDASTANTPDTELLEYIAAFEPVDGAWVDPMHFYDSFEADNTVKENDHE